MSTPCALAMFRTTGDDFVRRKSSRLDGAPVVGPLDACGPVGPIGPVGPDAELGPIGPTGPAEALDAPGPTGPTVVAVCSPFAPITATTLLTGTVSPSLTLISSSTPAPGEGISASTLSVEISNSGSSLSIASPTFLIQRTIVPSAIDSPIWGITTSVDIRTPSGQAQGPRPMAPGRALESFIGSHNVARPDSLGPWACRLGPTCVWPRHVPHARPLRQLPT